MWLTIRGGQIRTNPFRPAKPVLPIFSNKNRSCELYFRLLAQGEYPNLLANKQLKEEKKP